MIKTFGHQTIENTAESIGDRIKIGPVKSLINDTDGKEKEKPPFAGDGYYFWEDNLEAAEWWGKVHYTQKGKEFRIFRIDFTLNYQDNSFFDLIGSRQHLKLLSDLIKKTKKQHIDCQHWKLHNYISYFRLLAKRNNNMFPYKLIRFNDSKINPKIQDPLSLSMNDNFTLINPFYIICVFNIEDLNLKSYLFVK